VRPEQGLLRLRQELGVFANLRPVSMHPRLAAASPLKESVLRGVDVMVVRELTSGIYFGEKRRGDDWAEDVCAYAASEIERVVRVAARLARGRLKRVTSVDKANVLETSRLWREVTSRVVGQQFPDVALDHQLVDSCALRLVQHPASYDVIVTENLFGDILTDLAAVLQGGMGMAASASSAPGSVAPAMFEPVHGSAPDIAGQGIANPLGAIWSASLMLDHLGEPEAAKQVMDAIEKVCREGILTRDVGGRASTAEVGDAVAGRV